MKKRYVLKKEIKEELQQLGIEVLGIIFMAGLVYMLFILNAIMF